MSALLANLTRVALLLYATGLVASSLDGSVLMLAAGQRNFNGHSDPLASLFAMATLAQTPERRVIFTIGNHHAVLTQLPLYLTSMRMSDPTDMTRHLVVVCTDRKAHDMCRRLHHWCWCDACDTPLAAASSKSAGVPAGPGVVAGGAATAAQPPDGRQVEGVLRGSEFSVIGWRRQEIAAALVAMGFNTIATDMDLITLRNFLRSDVLDYASGADIIVEKENANAVDKRKNIGFYYVRSSRVTLQFFKRWLQPEHRGRWDQGIFNMLVDKERVPGLRWQHIPALVGVNICVVRTTYGAPIRSYQSLREATQKFCDDPQVSAQMAFFHCACWLHEYEFGKPDVMQLMLSMYHQQVNGLRQPVNPAVCEEKLANASRAEQALRRTVERLEYSRAVEHAS